MSTARWTAADLPDLTGRTAVVTGATSRGVGVITDAEGRPFVREQLGLGVGDHVYGLGERFTHFVKNGQVVESWNEDGGANSELAYKNVPFYLTSRGYGVFVDEPGDVAFEVGSENVGRVQFALPGERLSYMVVGGVDPVGKGGAVFRAGDLPGAGGLRRDHGFCELAQVGELEGCLSDVPDERFRPGALSLHR